MALPFINAKKNLPQKPPEKSAKTSHSRKIPDFRDSAIPTARKPACIAPSKQNLRAMDRAIYRINRLRPIHYTSGFSIPARQNHSRTPVNGTITHQTAEKCRRPAGPPPAAPDTRSREPDKTPDTQHLAPPHSRQQKNRHPGSRFLPVPPASSDTEKRIVPIIPTEHTTGETPCAQQSSVT